MSVVVCNFGTRTGCPEVDGGPHFFAHYGAFDGRVCLDCGAPESPTA